VSRNQWLIVAALALANVLVMGATVVVVIRYVTRVPPAPMPDPTMAASRRPTTTPPPTWTPTFSPTPRPTRTPRPSRTPTQTRTPWPTLPPTPPPTPSPPPPPISLENPTFEGIEENLIPGWQMGGFVNWAPGDEFDPASSYAAPRFHQADDPRQQIHGPTLQVDTVPWVKLRAWVFQSVEVEPNSRVQFQVRAVGFVKETGGGYILKAGVDPDGGEGCDAAQWGVQQIVNQQDGVVEIVSPEAVVGQAGRATVCAFAETQFAQVYHAAFFDDAVLTVLPPAGP
jgi:hypothetical protein